MPAFGEYPGQPFGAENKTEKADLTALEDSIASLEVQVNAILAALRKADIIGA